MAVRREGVVGPAGMPRPIVDKLAEQIGKRVTYSAARDKLAANGPEPLKRPTDLRPISRPKSIAGR
jgi:hypothetical protein